MNFFCLSNRNDLSSKIDSKPKPAKSKLKPQKNDLPTMKQCFLFPPILFLILSFSFAGTFEVELDKGLANEYGNKNIFDSGNVYEGKLKNGTYNGQCKLTYVNGMVFEGQIKKLTFNGRGKMTYPNDPKKFKHTMYEGEWKRGYWHGKGTLIFQDGRKYEGQFQYGHFLGKGKLTHPDGTVEEGTWIGEKLISKDKKTKVALRNFNHKYSEDDSRLYFVNSDDIYQKETLSINGVPPRIRWAGSYFYLPTGLNLLRIDLDGADHAKEILINVEPRKKYFIGIMIELGLEHWEGSYRVRRGTWDVDTGNLQVLANTRESRYFGVGVNSSSVEKIPIENLFTIKKGTRESIAFVWNRQTPCVKCGERIDTSSTQTSQDDTGYICNDCLKKNCFETTGTPLPLEKSKQMDLTSGSLGTPLPLEKSKQMDLVSGSLKAINLVNESKFDLALAKIDELFKIKPNEIGLFYLKAVCLFNTGDFTGSEDAVKKGLGVDPNHARLKEIQKKLDEENNPQSPSYHSREFSTLKKSFQDLMNEKKYQEILDKAKAQEVNFPGRKGDFHFVFANCYLELNQLDQAKECLKKALKFEPNNEQFIALRKKLEFDLIGHWEQAEKFIEQKQFIQATAQLDEALSVFQSDVKTQYLKSICLDNMEQKTSARLYILLALESDPSNETFAKQKEKVFQGDKEFVLNGTVESPEKPEWREGKSVVYLDNLMQLMFIVTEKQSHYLTFIGITDAILKEAKVWNDKHKEEIEKVSFYPFAAGLSKQ